MDVNGNIAATETNTISVTQYFGGVWQTQPVDFAV